MFNFSFQFALNESRKQHQPWNGYYPCMHTVRYSDSLIWSQTTSNHRDWARKCMKKLSPIYQCLSTLWPGFQFKPMHERDKWSKWASLVCIGYMVLTSAPKTRQNLGVNQWMQQFLNTYQVAHVNIIGTGAGCRNYFILLKLFLNSKQIFQRSIIGY